MTSSSRVSAGLLMYRIREASLQLLLCHPGGPFFKNKDEGAWSIPKGEPVNDETLFATARREFREETGLDPTEPFITLTPVRLKGGKTVHAWAFEGDCDPAMCVSNTFTIEWPPHSGEQTEYPESDRTEFFSVVMAKRKMNTGQVPFIEELEAMLNRENRFSSGSDVVE